MIKRIWNNPRLREIFLYCVVGGLTTLVNYAVYFLFTRAVGGWTGIDPGKSGWLAVLGTAVAWLFAVAFAFYPNKKYVFKSEGGDIRREIAGFVTARLLSLGVDAALMLLFVSALAMNDLIAKLITQIIVIAANYFASRFWIFRS